MMDTVLNLGLNDESVVGLAKQTDDERFAYDSYRRFVMMYGRIVLGIPGDEFDTEFEKIKEKEGTDNDAEVPADLLANITETFQAIGNKHTKKAYRQDPQRPPRGATEDV